MSTAGAAASARASPNTSAAPSRSWLRYCVIWLARTSNCCANSAKSLLALERLQGYRRLERRCVIAARSSRHGLSCSRLYWPPSGRKSTQPSVQISRATSRHYGREDFDEGNVRPDAVFWCLICVYHERTIGKLLNKPGFSCRGLCGYSGIILLRAPSSV